MKSSAQSGPGEEQQPEPPSSGPGAVGTAMEEHRRELVRRLGQGSGELRCFWSPGRVNLMGAHLDYNGGPVLPTSIDRGTYIALRPRSDGRVVLASTLEEATFEVDLCELPRQRLGRWSDYPLGVLLRLLERRAECGRPLPAGGLELLFGGDLPVGAGLSSSASICVGTALALGEAWGLDLGEQDHLDAALWAERNFVGVQCGIMDPFAVRLTRPGHLLWVDCKDESVEHLPLDASRARIVVADTGVRRELATGEFNKRVQQCREAFDQLAPHAPGATCLRDIPHAVLDARRADLSREVGLRAQHVIEEVERTFTAQGALLAGDLEAFGACITAAHASLRDLFEVSIPELDLLVEAACEWPGCFGTRLTGAGFGGCIVILMDASACEGFEEHLGRAFHGKFGRVPKVEFFRGAGGPREIE